MSVALDTVRATCIALVSFIMVSQIYIDSELSLSQQAVAGVYRRTSLFVGD